MFDRLLSKGGKELATQLVKSLYSEFDVERLERILAIGQTYDEGREEVRFMNEALAALIVERRKADR